MAGFPETDTMRLALLKALGESSAMAYTPASGSPKSIYGVFNAPFQASDLFNGSVENYEPSVTVLTSDLTGTEPRGGSIVIGGTTYTILTPEPDKVGITVLTLEEA